jgi:UDP-N-acetylglucosamine--N-acetylmuramyl-(pentapeptide) pyrophosphoryl-undecaprenol N-acetylglucosamine transferase
VVKILPLLAKAAPALQLLHLAGPNDAEKIRAACAPNHVRAVVHPFFAEMELALGAATVAISRAGASSLAELAAMRVPSVLVPYPAATDNHQFFNARAFEETGAAHLFEQNAPPKELEDLIPKMLAGLVLSLINDTAAHAKMQAALAGWHAPDAAEKIAETILQNLAEPATENSKFQVPSSKEDPKSNQRTALGIVCLGILFLGFLWNLELGTWNL